MSVADKLDFEEGSGRVVMENCSTTMFLDINKKSFPLRKILACKALSPKILQYLEK